MKKSDLRTGMWVRYRNGGMYEVLLDSKNGCREGDVSTDGKGWFNLKSYTDDLESWMSEGNDIVEVWSAVVTSDMINFPMSFSFSHYITGDRFYCIWEREETCHLTQNEAERILSETLGKKVEIRRSLNERN